ncbi:MAG TPA: methanol/ethanol family PQQ-dependent dehydrogenase [Chthoniobacterales bacterium]|nr:methanol/ethanol family PQQ-dependent dehydrogenase [Chthoniobacterales bacterium]
MAKCRFGLPTLLVGVALLSSEAQTSTPSAALPNSFGAEKEDGQWTMPAKNFQATRYSGLDQINATNAKDLKVAWTFSTGVNRGHEAAPIVVGDTMYVVTPFPNILYALDLKENGKLKWMYKPQPASAAQGVACCDTVNRGCVFSNGKLYFNTLDDHTICVDAATGKEVWKTKVGEINHGESITMAPLVVKDKVLVGNSGGEFGVRGWLKALDANSGKVVWTAWSTGPDSDVLIGPDFKPFYDKEKGKDLGVSTWPPNRWQIGGGTVWGWVTYDPESNLLFYGTGNPGVWNPELRPGDNKWSCGVFARDLDTGQARWYYQLNPHDLFDHDAVNENLVLDLPIGSAAASAVSADKPQSAATSTASALATAHATASPASNVPLRKVLLAAQRNGMVYIWDRTNGEVLSADPFIRITATFGVDLKTGKLKENPEKEPHTGVTIRDISPAAPGGKDWQPCAWSPRTNLLYIPHQNLAMDYEGTDANYIEGTPYVGMNVKMYANGGENRGEYCAWDPIARKKVWAIPEDLPVWSGTVATAGDVTFYGTMDGWFKCVNAKSGEVLWKFKCGSGIIGQPVTYKGPDGKQYVAILSGVGGWSGAIVAGGLDPKDPTGALGFVNAMKDLPDKTTKGGMLYVFALP